MDLVWEMVLCCGMMIPRTKKCWKLSRVGKKGSFSRVPPSLLNVPFGKQVDIKVMHKMEENYSAPKKPLQSFAGTGNRLGSIVPSASSMPGGFPSQSAPKPPQVVVDSTQPVTSIQIRLADGTRMVAKFNHSHTVGDIRAYIQAYFI